MNFAATGLVTNGEREHNLAGIGERLTFGLDKESANALS
jgi:hypothetical protein